MSHLASYKKYIAIENRIPRRDIKPNNIYRISTYKTRKDNVKRISDGDSSSLVYAIGIHDGQLNCLKLNEIPPSVFLKWLRKLVVPTVKMGDIEKLSDALIKTEKDGKKLFESYIKPDKSIYNNKYGAYRSYNMEGLRYIQEVYLTPNTLNKELKVKAEIDNE